MDKQTKAYFDKNFKTINARFEQIDARFEQIDARFEQIDARFEQIDRRFEKVDARFEKIDVELVGIKEELKEVKAIQLRMEHRHGDQLSAIWDKVSQFDDHIRDGSIHLPPKTV